MSERDKRITAYCFALWAWALQHNGPIFTTGDDPKPRNKPVKTCPHCKRPHQTGKAFCSAECCRNYKKR